MTTRLTGAQCPLCGDARFHHLFSASDRLYGTTQKSFQVVECADCGLVRLHPWPDPDELRQYYPGDYWFAPGQSTAAWFEELYRRLVLRDHTSFVTAILDNQEPGPVLDIGCGGALFGRLLQDRGHESFGLDFSQEAARVGWSVNRVPVVVGDFTLAPFKPGTFACVTMFHVLEHLYSPRSALSAVHALLRPGGHLVVQVPNAASWQFLLFGEAWNGIDVPRHLIDYRTKDVERFLKDCGFQVLRHKYFSLRDNPAGLATSVSPGLDPMARRVRGKPENGAVRLIKDFAYLGLVAAAVPLTMLEAACGAGSTVMLHARKADA